MRAAAGAELVAVMRRDRACRGGVREASRRAPRVRPHRRSAGRPGRRGGLCRHPERCHLPDTLAAAAAGRDVLCEKPLARSIAEADKMIRASRGGRGPPRRPASTSATTPGIGRSRGCSRPAGSVRSRPSGSTSRAGLRRRPGAWRQDPARGGGGSFTDMGVHCRGPAAVPVRRGARGDAHSWHACRDATAWRTRPARCSGWTAGSRRSSPRTGAPPIPAESRSSVIEIGGTDGTIVSWPLHDKFSRGTLLIACAMTVAVRRRRIVRAGTEHPRGPAG